MNKKYMAIIVLAILVIAGLYMISTKDDIGTEKEIIPDDAPEEPSGDSGNEIAIGEKAPNFTLEDLNDGKISLSDYEGRIVLINFWQTTCSYCVKEMPDLQRLDDENDDLVVLAVNVGEKEHIVDEFISDNDYDFKVSMDRDGKVARTYLVAAFPISYFVDEDGILLGAWPGMMTYSDMIGVIEQIREGN